MKFKYKQQVKVIKGFYEGSIGQVIEYKESAAWIEYRVRLFDGKEIIERETDIEPNADPQPTFIGKKTKESV